MMPPSGFYRPSRGAGLGVGGWEATQRKIERRGEGRGGDKRARTVEIISFTSLFLGLITGIHPVEVAVAKPVAVVELRLDGRTVGVMRQPPWSMPCDFGKTLRPHRIEAVALDAGGAVLASSDQWVNMPRRDAEAEIIVARDDRGVPVEARIAWDSLQFKEPRSIDAALDGSPLKADPHGRFKLPAFGEGRLHLLTARVEFPRGIVATAEVAVGGTDQQAAAELSSVPIVLGDGVPTPEPASLEGALVADGALRRVVAIEDGPAEVVIVCDSRSGRSLKRLEGRNEYLRLPRNAGALGDDDEVRLMLTTSRPIQNRGRTVTLFDLSERFTIGDGGVPRLLMGLVPRMVENGRQSIADAVAVAGMEATRNNRRRAVVLVLGTGENDRSVYAIPAVRDFLVSLRVPLHVWSVLAPDSKKTVTSWGPAEDASSAGAMDAAVGRLRTALSLQRIVWIEGRHLPCDVTLAASQGSLRLAGGIR
jgi:hypothetical protein